MRVCEGDADTFSRFGVSAPSTPKGKSAKRQKLQQSMAATTHAKR